MAKRDESADNQSDEVYEETANFDVAVEPEPAAGEPEAADPVATEEPAEDGEERVDSTGRVKYPWEV